MTHDLIKITIEKLEAKILRVIVNDIKNGTFYAIIEIQTKDGKKFDLDSRPSDALAVAVRTKAPIFVSENVMMQAKLVNAEKDAEDAKNFKEFVDNLKPEDFLKYFKNE